LKNGLFIILLFTSFSAFSQKATASAQQTITLRLSAISIVEKTQPISTETINATGPTVQVHSAKKWITKTNSISDTDESEEFNNTNDFIEFSEEGEELATKIVTLSNI
jgi:hypothetical protein